MTQKITPFLWFDNNAEEAINFYCSIFKDSRLKSAHRYPKGGPGPEGKLMTATFELNGQEFMALNGGPRFKFTEAVSMFVHCDSQVEVDEYWNKLLEGGQAQMCGWLKDRFGLSWQIIPRQLGELLGAKEPERAQRVMNAMLQMQKIDVTKLEHAYQA